MGEKLNWPQWFSLDHGAAVICVRSIGRGRGLVWNFLTFKNKLKGGKPYTLIFKGFLLITVIFTVPMLLLPSVVFRGETSGPVGSVVGLPVGLLSWLARLDEEENHLRFRAKLHRWRRLPPSFSWGGGDLGELELFGLSFSSGSTVLDRRILGAGGSLILWRRKRRRAELTKKKTKEDKQFPVGRKLMAAGNFRENF